MNGRGSRGKNMLMVEKGHLCEINARVFSEQLQDDKRGQDRARRGDHGTSIFFTETISVVLQVNITRWQKAHSFSSSCYKALETPS